MGQYQRKPDIVEAMQFQGDDGMLVITTPDGPVSVAPGDWVVTQLDGTIRVVHPELFDKLYAPV